MSSGCATSGSVQQEINLPSPAAAGDLLKPVPVPQPKRGDDARSFAARTRAALVEANGRIVGGCRWYDGVRRSYAPAAGEYACEASPSKP